MPDLISASNRQMISWCRQYKVPANARLPPHLQVMQDADVPADLLFLAGSDKASNIALVETSSLDGETSLKQKACYASTKGVCTAADLSEISQTCFVKCERPNERYDMAAFVRSHAHLSGDEVTDWLNALHGTVHIRSCMSACTVSAQAVRL